MSTLRGVVLYESIGETHGEVGVAIVRLVLLHLHESLCEQALVVVDDIVVLLLLAHHLHQHIGQRVGIDQRGVALTQRAVGHETVEAVGVQTDGAGIEVACIGSAIALVEAVYHLVAGRVELPVGHLLAVVVEQSCHGGLIEACIVVLEEVLECLLGGTQLGAVGILGKSVEHACHAVDFYSAHEGLAEEALCIHRLASGLIGCLQLGEHLPEPALQGGILRVPVTYALLELLLLPYHTQVGDGLVHSYGVLPVVAAAGPFAGILDAYGTVGVHKLLPHLLLAATYLDGAHIAVVHTLADAP